MILCWDTGNLVEIARRIARNEDVAYFVEWANDVPKFYHYGVGQGFRNIEKIKQFDSHIDKADVICFFDIGKGEMAARLRKEGKTVFGGGLGEELELNRIYAKKVQKEIGLPVQPYRVIKGIENVIEHVKRSPEKFIKISTYRGDMESFFADDWETAKNQLRKFSSKVGPFADSFEFMVEEKIDSVVESGFDLFFNGEDFLRPYLWGYIVGDAYYGRWVEELPGVLDAVAEKIKPVLRKFGVRGAVSVEVMITKEEKPYLLDWTIRFARPLSLMHTAIENFTEIIEAAAHGEDIDIEPPYEYCGIQPYKSHESVDDWMKVSFPKSYEDRIKGLSIARVEDNIYVSPGNDIPIAAIGWGDSLEDVYDEIDEAGAEIHAYDVNVLDCDRKKADAIVEKGESVGLEWT